MYGYLAGFSSPESIFAEKILIYRKYVTKTGNIYVFSLQVSETQTYYAGGLQTPSKSILTLLPGYIALKLDCIK